MIPVFELSPKGAVHCDHARSAQWIDHEEAGVPFHHWVLIRKPESVADLPVNAAQKLGVVDDKTRLLVQTDTSRKDVILDYPYPIPELIHVNASEHLKQLKTCT